MRDTAMKGLLSAMMAAALAAAIAAPAPAQAAGADALDGAAAAAAAYISGAVTAPAVGSVGGEWAVIGLARSGYELPDAYFEGYRRAVEDYVEECGGVLHDKKYTEYSRVILGLTAAGYDPRDVAGYDLTAALGDFERTVWQGINGPIWALIALDSRDYDIPENKAAKVQAQRGLYVDDILRRQLPDGGFSLLADSGAQAGDTVKGDPDITGMALQALAKYQDKPGVREATEKALAFLSGAQDGKGGYAGWGDPNSESVVQVLVALCELGVPQDDPRFVKNGHTLIDNILSFQNRDGSFSHTAGGSGNGMMSTEQALYGLVAAQRARDGKNSLYRMGDAARRGDGAEAGAGLPGRDPDVRPSPVTAPGKTFDDIQGREDQAAIEGLAARGIVNGRAAGDGAPGFDPDGSMTRAEFSAIVVRGLGLEGRLQTAFGDVPAEAWYAGAVGAARHYGIVTGLSDTVFGPDGTITRQEAAVMTARAARLCGLDTSFDAAATRDALAQFGDYRSAAGWAQDSLAFCYSSGILDDSALDIRPGEAVTRAEIAGMLYRMLDRAELLRVEPI